MIRFFKRLIKRLLIVGIFLAVIVLILLARSPVLPTQAYGITFHADSARYYEIDVEASYRAIFEELGLKKLRLGAYWSKHEPEEGRYDFSELDWLLNIAREYDAEVILALGRKVPRWPECHIPEWARDLPRHEQDEALFAYMREVINRYKDDEIIEIWQVENEPFLPFGECPKGVAKTLDQEIALVKEIDPTRPVLTTDSGELSVWIPAAKRGDMFGTTLYRRVVNKFTGFLEYPIPAGFFRVKRSVTELFAGRKPMVVIELQGEPWLDKPVKWATVEEMYRSVDPEYMKEILDYAHRSGFDTHYLWGAEWWYWMREHHGRPEMWDLIKKTVEDLEKDRLVEG